MGIVGIILVVINVGIIVPVVLTSGGNNTNKTASSTKSPSTVISTTATTTTTRAVTTTTTTTAVTTTTTTTSVTQGKTELPSQKIYEHVPQKSLQTFSKCFFLTSNEILGSIWCRW